MLNLVTMSEEAFTEFRTIAVANYASELATSEGRSLDANDVVRADASLNRMLPQGRGTPGHRFFILHATDGSVAIGSLWLGESASEHGRSAFIYDIFVRPEHRGQGYGTHALQAAEAWARTLGCLHIDLQVFGHNAGAQRLYSRLGYGAKNIRMRKLLVSAAATAVSVPDF
jgi:RimJ/RimL family protein N-acetyltransferase